MQGLILGAAVILLGITVPAKQNAEDARECALRGYEWAQKGELDKAIAAYNQALANNPRLANAYVNRGIAWGKKGEYDKAIADCNEVIRLNPKDAKAFSFRATMWHAKGDYERAITDYSEALRLDPKNAVTLNNLAALYATCPNKKYRDGAKAVENATKAYQLDGGKNWSLLDTLAAAYAECGDFEKAKQWQAKAIEMTKTDKSATDKDKAEAHSRLELYKQEKPYRDELKKK